MGSTAMCLTLFLIIQFDLTTSVSQNLVKPTIEMFVDKLNFDFEQKEATDIHDSIDEMLVELNRQMLQLWQIDGERSPNTEALVKFPSLLTSSDFLELRDLLIRLDDLYYKEFAPCFIVKSGCCKEQLKECFERYSPTPYAVDNVLWKINLLSYAEYVGRRQLLDSLTDAYNRKVKSGTNCGSKRSLNQEILDFYNAFLEIVVGNYMGIYTLKYKRYYHEMFNGNQTNNISLLIWNNEWAAVIDILKLNGVKMTEIISSVLKNVSREIFPCDPDNWDNNYAAMKYFMNSYIANERQLNANHVCSRTCRDYVDTRYYPDEYSVTELECPGKIYECQDVDVNAVSVPVNEGFQKGVGPRYSFVGKVWCDGESTLEKKYGKGFFSNENGVCSFGAGKFYSTEINPYPRCGFYRSDTCRCICDNLNHTHTVRRLSHRMITSDVSSGYVITGVKFDDIEGGYQINIQEGLLKNGKIQKNTTRWASSDKYPPANINDTLTYYQRCVNFDSVEAPVGYVITGVAFTKVGDCHALKLQATKFDTNGNLIPTEVLSITAPSNKARTEISLNTPDESNLAPLKNKVLSRPSQHFIKFQVTDWDKDASQHVVPYLDTQAVITDSPVPIGGIGIHYKGSDGYGGFIGLSVFSPSYELTLDENKITRAFDEIAAKSLLKIN